MSVQPRISFPPFTAFSHLIPGPNCHTVCLLPFPSRLKEVARHCAASNIAELERPIDHCIKQRNEIRLGLPSKGRMASETLDLLEDCQLSVKQKNPRQYVAVIPQLPNVEVWFQRPKDIVRKLLFGDLDLGIVGLDTVMEYGQGSDDLVMVHDALAFGDCRLSLAVPTNGIFENVNSFLEMSRMPEWTVDTPLRIATGFCYLGEKFFSENGMKYISFSVGDGALEAAPAMGSADAVLDLVGSGTTLKENHLKEIEGGIVMESQAVLVGSRKSLLQERRSPLLITREILERLEAHLRAAGQFTVTANMRGSSAEQVAARVLSQPSLSGLEGPTVSPVFCRCSQPSSDHHRDDRNGSELSSSSRCSIDYYAVVICVPKRALYKSVQQLRAIGGSGVLVSPLTYIFEEESPRWRTLLSTLNMSL